VSDKLTLLRSTGGQRLTKLWRADGTIASYGDPYLFEVSEASVSSIQELSALLTQLESDPLTCLLRYAHAGPRGQPCRRLGSIFCDQPLQTLCIDVDDFAPLSCDPVAEPLTAVLEYIKTMLPEPFRDASFHWQLSSSAGHPTKPGLRAHLWFWLKEPRTSAALKKWADANAKRYHLDAALYRTVQIHYTASPVFAEGTIDPISIRSGLCQAGYGGYDAVALDIEDLPPAPVKVVGPTAERRALSDWDRSRVLSVLAHPGFRDAATIQGWSGCIGYPLLSCGERQLWMDVCDDKPAAEKWWNDHASAEVRSGPEHLFAFAESLGWVNPGSSDPGDFPIDLVGDISPKHVAPLKAFNAVRAFNLTTNSNGAPHANVNNATRTIKLLLLGALTYDEFLNTIQVRWPGESRERSWTDTDTTRLQKQLQELGMSQMSSTNTYDAVRLVAAQHTTNVIEDWLFGLAWDGTRRLSTLLSRGFGTVEDRHNIRAGRNMLIAMVARAFRPGCQVDEALVFEGEQGTLKTSALQIIGGAYFAELTAHPGHKDFEQQLRGVWLGEFSELATVKRADDIEKLKQFITCKKDHYRPSYGRVTLDFLRRVVLCGTTNRSDWNNDPTGARRFIPVAVGKIDLPWLRENRDQLFAEAVALYQAGRKWWCYPATTHEMQEARHIYDPWAAAITRYLHGRSEITDLSELLEWALRIPPAQQDVAKKRRAGITLSYLGCISQPRRRTGPRIENRLIYPWKVPAHWAVLPILVDGHEEFPIQAAAS
jgi:predicted P-loop ATPase